MGSAPPCSGSRVHPDRTQGCPAGPGTGRAEAGWRLGRLSPPLAIGRALIERPGRVLPRRTFMLAGRGPRRPPWRRPCGQVEAGEDLARHLRVLDGREQPHACAAARAAQRIHLEHTLQQPSPRESTRLRGRRADGWRIPGSRAKSPSGISLPKRKPASSSGTAAPRRHSHGTASAACSPQAPPTERRSGIFRRRKRF